MINVKEKPYNHAIIVLLTFIILCSMIFENIPITACAQGISEFTVNLDISGDGGTVIFKDESTSEEIRQVISSGAAVFQGTLDNAASYTVYVEGITGYSYYETNVFLTGTTSKNITMNPTSRATVARNIIDGDDDAENVVAEAEEHASGSATVDKNNSAAPIISAVNIQCTWHAVENTVDFIVTNESDLITGVYYASSSSYALAYDKAEIQGNNDKYSFSVTDNGIYYIFAVDSAENVAMEQVIIDHIDTDSPVVAEPVVKHPYGEWTNDSITISGSFTDTQSTGVSEGAGVAHVVYSTEYATYQEAYDNGDLHDAILNRDKFQIITSDEEFNGYYYIWALDNVGKVSPDGISIEVKIDNTRPHDLTLAYSKEEERGFIKQVVHYLTFGYFFKDKIGIDITAKDTRIDDAKDELVSGLSHYEYQLVGDEEVAEAKEVTIDNIKEDAWILVDDANESVQIDIPYYEFTGKVYIRAWDRAGNGTESVTNIDTNTGTIGTTIVVDGKTNMEAPLLELNGYNNGNWTNEDVVITLSEAETLSGVDYYQYRVEYEDADKTSLDWTPMTESDGVWNHVLVNTTINNQISIKSDENATYYFRAMSNTEVPSIESEGVIIRVQKTPPSNAAIEIEAPNGLENWYVNKYPTIEIIEPIIGPLSVAVTTYYKLWNTAEETELTAATITLSEETQPKLMEDGIYKLRIWTIDETGNQCVYSAIFEKEIKVDLTAPNIGELTKTPDSSRNKDWNNCMVDIKVPIIEDLSGVAKVVYSTEYSAYKDAVWNSSLGEAHLRDGQYLITTPVDEFNGTYYIWAVDIAGNISADETLTEVKIDTTQPHDLMLAYSKDKNRGFVKEVVNILTLGYFYRDMIGITITAKDTRVNDNKEELVSGLSHYEYQLVEDKDVNDDVEVSIYDIVEDGWHPIKDNSELVEVDIPYEEFAGKVYIRAWDIAGNYTVAVTDINTNAGTMGTTVVMDQETSDEAPFIDANGYIGNTWTNEDVIISLSGAKTLSGVDYYQYRIDYADSSLPSVTWTTMPQTDTLLPHAETGTFINNQIIIHQDVNATYSFRSVSNTGVKSDKVSSIVIKVQKTLPYNAVVSMPVPNGKNNWYVGQHPPIKITQSTVNEYTAPVTAYYKLWDTTKGETEETAAKVIFRGSNNPVIEEDGIYYLKVWSVDEAGNYCASSNIIKKEAKVGITAPTNLAIRVGNDSIIAKVKNSVAFDIFYNNEIKVELSANCNISGLKSLMYQKVKSVSSYNTVTAAWINYNSVTGIVVNPNEKFVIYFRVEDMAGNITIINSDGVVVDNQAPVGERLAPDITISPAQANSNGLYNSNVKVNIATTDPQYLESKIDISNGVYSGLACVSYCIWKDNVVTKEETVLFPSNSYSYTADSDGVVQTWSGDIIIDSASNNSNNVVVEVTTIDNAGNSRTTRTAVGDIKIDTTTPSIDISYDNNSADTIASDYFNADRVATIVITERNFNAADVLINVTNKGGSTPSVSPWSEQPGPGNGDGTTHTATITYRADGDYTFDISYMDLAGNKCNGERYASGTVAPTGFTIDQSEPQITVSYDNNAVSQGKYFQACRTATVTVTEHNFDADRITYTRSSTKEGRIIDEPKLSSWSNNGDVHSATIQYAADGDYTFDMEMEDMAGNKNDRVNYGSSAASKDFVIDTNIIKPTITGIENGISYKGDVIPVINFEDINYDSYEISLLRTRKDEKEIDVTSQFITDITISNKGGRGSFDTFEKIQDNDGIYTLTVKIVDKARNEMMEEVIFSVNRFGSVYVFSDYLASLQDEYVQKVSDAIIITEYNPDKLIEDSLQLEITLDGAPLSEVKYEVTPVINDKVNTGDSGWYQYEYSINTDNFDKDGIYKIVVSSEDRAGNAPENTNYDDLGILFRVDTTKPELTNVVGLESNLINAEAVLVTFDVFDAIGLKEIFVYVNDSFVEKYDAHEDMVNFSGSFEIGEGVNQYVRIVMEDMAGNITDTADDDFSTGFKFMRIVTISTNAFVQWYANRLIFWFSIICSVFVVAGIVLLFLKKKKGEDKGNHKKEL